MQNLTRIGTLALVAIVALRIGVGWHFFKEGSDKIKSGNFSSDGFLKASNGRLAGFFHGMVWDYDGKIRLDRELMTNEIDQSVARATKHFGLTQEQIDDLDKRKIVVVAGLTEVYATHSEAITKLLKGEARIAKMDSSPIWNQVDSLREQKESIAKERLSGIAPAVKAVDEVWQQLEDEINTVATAEQIKASRKFRLHRPKDGVISSTTVDRIIPVFDITVGVLLIVGLFVPVAGWAGALFLFSVVLSQFPGDPGTTPTYLYFIEALALIVLACLGAGRFGGLDFLIWAWRKNRNAKPAAN